MMGRGVGCAARLLVAGVPGGVDALDQPVHVIPSPFNIAQAGMTAESQSAASDLAPDNQQPSHLIAYCAAALAAVIDGFALRMIQISKAVETTVALPKRSSD